MANRYWVGGGGNWSDDTNHWATTSGGSPGAGNLPGAGDIAIFNGSSGGGTCTFDGYVSITGITLASGNTTIVDQSTSNYDCDLAGNLSVVAGTYRVRGGYISVVGNISLTGGNFVGYTGTIYFDGNWSNTSGGVFTRNTGTVVAEGGAAQNITTRGYSFYRFTMNGTGATLQDDFTCTSDLVIQAGTFDTSVSNYAVSCLTLDIQGGNITANGSTITVNGNCTIADIDSIFTAGTSTVVLGATGNLANKNTGNAFYNLTINASVTTTFTEMVECSGGTIAIDDTATLTLAGFGIGFGAGCTFNSTAASISGGEFQFHTGTTTFGALTATTLYMALYGGTLSLAGDLDVFSVATTFGTFTTNDYTVTVDGLFSGSSSEVIGNTVVNLGASTVDIATEFVVNNATTAATVTLNLESSSINLAGNWNVTTATRVTVNQGTSTVTLDGTTGTQQITSRAKSFYNFTMNNDGATMQLLSNGLTCTGNFLREAGIIYLNALNITCVNFTINNGSTTTFYTTGAHTLNSRTITCSGNCSLNGQVANLLNMNATVNCNMAVTGTLTADYVNLAYNTATVSAGTTTNSTKGAAVINWDVVIAGVMKLMMFYKRQRSG